jgi:hypothetical protein
MTLVNTVCVVEAQDAAIVDSKQMGQKESEVVAHDLTLCVDPDFLANDGGPTRTPKLAFIVGVFAKANPSPHWNILWQVMRLTQHLQSLTRRIHLEPRKRPAG